MADVLYVGGATQLVTRVEATYGTDAAGTDDKCGLVTNFVSNMKNNMIQIYTLGGGRSYQQIVPGKFEVSGSFEADVQNGFLMRYALGAVSAATTTTTNFDGTTITGTPTSALKRYAVTETDAIPSFTMQVTNQSAVIAASTDIKTIYTGVKINQFGIKFDTENPLHATYDWIAQKPSTTTGDFSALAPITHTAVPQMFYRGQLLIATGDYGASGTGTASTLTDTTKAWTVDQWKTNWVMIDSLGLASAISTNSATALTVTGTPTTGKYWIVPLSTTAANQVVQCNSIDITVAQNLEPYWSVSNDTARGVKFLVEKQREYSLNLDLNFTNVDQLVRFYKGAGTATNPDVPTTTSDYTKFAVVVDCKTATADGDAYRALKLIFTDCVFDETSLPVNPKDIVKQTVACKARNCAAFFITTETA